MGYTAKHVNFYFNYMPVEVPRVGVKRAKSRIRASARFMIMIICVDDVDGVDDVDDNIDDIVALVDDDDDHEDDDADEND